MFICKLSDDDTANEWYSKWAKNLEQEALSTKESITSSKMFIHNPKRDTNQEFFNFIFQGQTEEKNCLCLEKKSPNFLQAINKIKSPSIHSLLFKR